MEFLENYGIRPDTIASLLDQYSDNVIFNFIANKTNVEKIMVYLRKNHVEDINLFLLNYFELFLKPIETVQTMLPTENWIHALEEGSVTLDKVLS